METLSENQRELISAYLDGALEGAELREAESLLEQNASAASLLSQLSSQRSWLQRTALQLDQTAARGSRASRHGIGNHGIGNTAGDNLAARVIAQAQQLARQQGLPSTHHVLAASDVLAGRHKNTAFDNVAASSTGSDWIEASENHSRRDGSSRQQAPSRRGAWFVIASTAAAILALALLPMRSNTRQALFSDGLVRNEPAPAGADPVAADPAPVDQADTLPSGSKVVAQGSRTPQQMHESLAPLGIELLTVLDVQMTRAGWESARFDQLLGELGIRGTTDVVAQSEFVQALLDDQMLIADASAQPTDAEVVLMYIKCPAAVAEKLLVSIESERSSFSGFKYNMVMGGLGSSSQLLGALRNQMSRAGNDPGASFSRMIVLADGQARQLVSAFRAANLSGNDMPVGTDQLNARQAGGSLFAAASEKQPTELLFILRQQ